MTYTEFLSKQFPEKSVFDRPQFDFHTNLVKWCTLPFSYLWFRLGLSANALDIIGLLISLSGFLLLSTAASGNQTLPIIGIGLIFIHVLIDFMDGPVAKARGDCSAIGGLLDEVGCHIDRFVLIVLLGFFSNHASLILANLFAATVIEFVVHQTKGEIPKTGIPGLFLKIYINKFSFLSMRFTLVLLPAFLGAVIVSGGNLSLVATILSVFYVGAAAGWLFLCLPQYSKKDA